MITEWMMKRLRITFLCFSLSVVFLATPGQIMATLGESADAVVSERKTLSAVNLTITVHNGYTVHELTLAGTVLREYVSPSGIVFGIAWNGLTHPDLSSLAGMSS